MFKAKHSSGAVYTIYAVQQNANMKNLFLIFHEGMQAWLWMDAMEFKPDGQL